MNNLTLINFLNTIFDVGDHTCFTDSPFGTTVSPWPRNQDEFFCINALEPFQDMKPEKPHHKPNLARRADHNVTKFRTLLLEMDSMAIEEQIRYVTSALPVTSITYSGGKSYHFLITLETPLKNKAEYVHLFKRIQTLLPDIDPANKNPSRLSRLPFATRYDSGKEQRLVQLNSRVKFEDLDKLLPNISEVVFVQDFTNPKTREYIAVEILEACADPDQKIEEKGLAGRNLFFYWMSCRMNDLGYPIEQKKKYIDMAYQNLKRKEGFSYTEALMAARLN